MINWVCVCLFVCAPQIKSREILCTSFICWQRLIIMWCHLTTWCLVYSVPSSQSSQGPSGAPLLPYLVYHCSPHPAPWRHSSLPHSTTKVSSQGYKSRSFLPLHPCNNVLGEMTTCPQEVQEVQAFTSLHFTPHICLVRIQSQNMSIQEGENMILNSRKNKEGEF